MTLYEACQAGRPFFSQLRRIAICATALIALVVTPGADLRAGGGPENVLLVVNPRSWASLTVANHFVRLRKIPSSNIFYLEWTGEVGGPTDAKAFRERILVPIESEIRKRNLAPQIDYVIYSADFPYAVTVRSEFGEQPIPQPITPIASINGLTYDSQRFLARDLNYLRMDSNQYMRRQDENAHSIPTHGFRHWYGWAEDGRLLDAGGPHYRLSMMLAMTSGRGNSVDTAIRYLNRSAQADGTRPGGTIYFAENSDKRAQARVPAFAAARRALAALSVRAEIVSGVLPRGKDDVQGLLTGAADFRFGESGSTIRPGAICEHLTSFGGRMHERSKQTPLTEFLRYGAAGASGTVTEPYLILQKFPFPFIQVHYARGCTLAEAFYQSVHGPYQLLIVGDPLCRPWARIPKVTASGVEPNQVVSGDVRLEPAADLDVARFELFVDGIRRSSCRPGGVLKLDTRGLVDGFHELRIVAIEDSAIESQGRLIVPIQTANFGQAMRPRIVVDANSPDDRHVTIRVSAEGANRIQVYQMSQRLGSFTGSAGSLELKKSELGFGPISLRAVALSGTSAGDVVLSNPHEIAVAEPAPMPALGGRDFGRMRAGLRLATNGASTSVTDTSRPNWLQAAGVVGGQTYEIEAYFQVSQQDVYQFQLRGSGSIELSVDGQVMLGRASEANLDMNYVPIALAPGVHRVEIKGTAARRPRLDVWFGGPGARKIDGKRFRHARL